MGSHHSAVVPVPRRRADCAVPGVLVVVWCSDIPPFILALFAVAATTTPQ